MDLELCDYGIVTIEDCLDMHDKKNMDTIIDNGKVVGFERSDNED